MTLPPPTAGETAVESPDGCQDRRVIGLRDIEDARQRGNPCKHGWAAVLFTACERLDAEQSDPTCAPIPYALTPRAYAALAAAEPVPAA